MSQIMDENKIFYGICQRIADVIECFDLSFILVKG